MSSRIPAPVSQLRPQGSLRPPSVEAVLVEVRPRVGSGVGERDPDALTAVVREVIADERARLSRQAGSTAASPQTASDLADEVVRRLAILDGRVGAEPVINATGVLIHTNLGRTSWAETAIAAAAAAARDPVMLEFDRDTGRRGRRFREVDAHLIALTGADDALVVNNNAAAVALAVALAGRGGVVVSRGELVEIGGGVRVPEIVRRAGARLIEVGTTNRTRAEDYEEPLAAGRARLVLRVHPSNFRQTGFTESPDPRAVAALAHAHGALVVDDLGSGALLDTERVGLVHEPTPRERLADGADVVTFSGDKLVGGPQAGFVVGRADLIGRLRRDPLARAMRPDKVVLAAVTATLASYRAGTALRDIPVWRQLSTPVAALEVRAQAIVARLADAHVVPVESTVGGGSLPGETLPSRAVALRVASPDRLLRRLRMGVPAVIGRIEGDQVVLDLRTVDPAHDDDLTGAVGRALAGKR